MHFDHINLNRYAVLFGAERQQAREHALSHPFSSRVREMRNKKYAACF